MVALYRQDGSWRLGSELVDKIRSCAGRRYEVFQATSDAEVASRFADAEIIFGWQVSSKSIAKAKKLRWIQVGSAGVDGMLFPALVKSRIVLTSAVGIHAVQISETALGMMIALTRQFPKFIRAQERSLWARDVTAADLGELYEKTLGIIGLGRIGEALAVRAKALGMRVIGVKRTAKGYRGAADEVVGMKGLGAVMAESDYVVALLPNTPATAGVISVEVIARMKPTARFLNFGRGTAVDEKALAKALSKGKIAGAGQFLRRS
jgi:D-2-hydroxyacid dehydrogenase (NADP+)